jgi:Carboxypeptidase regulatory-like domain
MVLSGRWQWCIASTLFWAATLVAQTPPISPATKSTADDTCTVSGMVVAKADGTPLKGATVQLLATANTDHEIAVKSGVDGHFLLKNVPAGDYHLTVSRNGYSELKYGQKKAGDPGALFRLEPGQNMSDLLFRMGRTGVISGKVFDEDGEPMAGVEVEALRNIYRDGRREMVLAASGQSNDLGEFRLYGLTPGRYFVSADQAPWNREVVGEKEFNGATSNSGEKGYGRVYYPNTVVPDKASAFMVKEGEEIPSIDFLMKEITVYRIRGKVLNLVSKQGTGNIQVSVFPRKQEMNVLSFNANNIAKADGSFELPEIAPGEYTVSAVLFDEGKTYSTQQDVDVVASDVDGLVLSLTAGVTIPGRINWEGRPSQRKDGTSIYLESEMSRFGIGRAEAHIDEDWQFTLKEVPDGTFEVHLVDLSEDYYIKEVRFGDTLLPDRELRVRGAGANLEITVSSHGARISGTVLNTDSLPVAGAWVVAVPEGEKRKFLRLFRARSTDQYGHFEIHGLAPGKYKLFSWDGIEARAWQDPDFLKDYEDKGQEIEVQDGDQKSLELKSLSAKDSE